MATYGAVADLVSISSDGKDVVRFERARMSDVPQPVPGAFFATGSDVYLLTRSVVPTSETRKLRDPTGSVKDVPLTRSQYVIAHFKSDGSYIGAIPLDIPFTPLQLGVFIDGGFLVAGVAKDANEPKIALVRSNGQFHRFVDLQGDIQLRSDQSGSEREPPSTSLPRVGKRFGEGFSDSLHNSAIVPYGRNLLLLRSGQDTPVFSISPGGSAEAVHLEAPEGYKLWALKTVANEWTALYTRRISDTEGVEFATFALEPTTGKAIARYTYPKFLGFAMACADGVEFSFLVRENEKLKIVKLLSTRRSSSKKHAGTQDKKPQ